MATRTIQAQDMVLIDESMDLFISRQFAPGSLPPLFGQKVYASAAAAASDTTVAVEPLAERIPSGTALAFSGGDTATLTIAAKEGDTSLTVSALAAGIALGETATTSSIEQTVTLAAAVTAGDRAITVSALSASVEKGRTLTFSPSGVEVVVKHDAAAGATSIFIEPATLAIPDAETADLENFETVYSLAQADSSSSSNVLSDRVFKSGIWTPKKVTSRDATISISGQFIKNDFGLARMDAAKRQIENKLYFVLLEPTGGKHLKGWCDVGDDSQTRGVDQHKSISVTLQVDGELYEASYERS